MALNNIYLLLLWIIIALLLFLVQMIWKRGQNANRIKVQKLILLLGSYFFITWSDWRYGVVVFISTVIIYSVGIALQKAQTEQMKKSIVVLACIYLVGLLGFFKYSNFAIAELSQRWGICDRNLRIIMPLGISYYTFSAITYIVDIYKGKIKSERNVIDFALLFVFFPKFVAGPIVKARDFLPRLKGYNGICVEQVEAGIQIFAIGLFKKIVLADHLAVFVNDVYWAPTAYNSGTIWLAVISYSLQIYLDFSGYTDMAIGIARTLGIELPANFYFPYLASNISEFWKRWHISLSSFLQEYVYYPLGGNRKGKIKTYLNLMCVMLISGLWHGEGLTFLVWGGLHGCFSCVHHILKQKGLSDICGKKIQIIWNFFIVSIAWIFFRAANIKNALLILRGMFCFQTGIRQPYMWSFIAIICCLVGSVCFGRIGEGKYPTLKLNGILNWFLFFTFVGLTIILGYFGNTAFIYGGF